jgi:Tfp pilus assembly protein PilE
MPSKIAVIKKNYPQKITTYTVLIILLLAGSAYYSYQQYMRLTDSQNALAAEQDQSDKLATTGDQYEKDFNNMKTAFNTDFKSTLDALQKVFPASEDYTGMTRQLDTFFLSTNPTTDALYNPNLSFSTSQAGEDYSVLPFTMTVQASKEGFDKLMRYIESSGALEGQTRLMDIQSITINLPEQAAAGTTPAGGSEGPQILNLSLNMNSYFQKPVTP